jgi:hypothetical protein
MGCKDITTAKAKAQGKFKLLNLLQNKNELKLDQDRRIDDQIDLLIGL